MANKLTVKIQEKKDALVVICISCIVAVFSFMVFQFFNPANNLVKNFNNTTTTFVAPNFLTIPTTTTTTAPINTGVIARRTRNSSSTTGFPSLSTTTAPVSTTTPQTTSTTTVKKLVCTPDATIPLTLETTPGTICANM